ncbi:MAG: ATPase [Alphaproteobacteria bacterium]|nr:ATPase [Alphaproteobacteria bacterium]
MRRKYKTVEVAESGGGYGISLDRKPMRTPAGKRFEVRQRPLAEAVAEEWRAQGDKVDPRSMPMTRFVATALDRIAVERDRIVGELAAFAETDLLCHRADRPAELIERQKKGWQPLLDWAEEEIGARFDIATGVMPLVQPPATLAAVRVRIAALDDLELAGIQTLAGGTGSIVLAFAVFLGRIGWEEGHRLSRLDEDHQIERWGEDPEAAERRKSIHADLADAARLLSLVRVRH